MARTIESARTTGRLPSVFPEALRELGEVVETGGSGDSRRDRLSDYDDITACLWPPGTRLGMGENGVRRAAPCFQQTGNVAEVAYAVGFKNLSHFAKRFREHLHQTPAAYAAARKPQARGSNDTAGDEGAQMPRH